MSGRGDAEAWKSSCVESVWRDNYTSAKLHSDVTTNRLEDCVSNGWAVKLSEDEARRAYPQLVVSSLGAAAKKDAKSGEITGVRIVLDGTHGVGINTRLRGRDQDRCPTAADAPMQQ